MLQKFYVKHDKILFFASYDKKFWSGYTQPSELGMKEDTRCSDERPHPGSRDII